MSAAQHPTVSAIGQTPSGVVVNPSWALFLRRGLGCVLLFEVLGLWPDLKEMAGPHAIVPSGFAELVDPWWLPRIGWFAPILSHVGLSGQSAIVFFFALYALLLVALIANVFPKSVSILVFALHIIITGSIHFSLYGVDQFASIGLFYCALAPAGVSLQEGSDALWRSTAVHRLLQFHIAVTYAASGILKSIGPQWWSGEAVWLALGQPVSHGPVDAMRLMEIPGVAKAAGISVLIIEICYPIFMARKNTRSLWLTLVVLMHLGIGMFMNMWFFAFVMIVLNISAFGEKYVEAIANRQKQRLSHS